MIRTVATDLTAATASDELLGGAGDDGLSGGNSADTVEGGAGDDLLSGSRGADAFAFRDGQATCTDVVTDFERGGDAVLLVGFGAGFDALANLSAVEGGTALDLGGDTILFLGRVAFFAAEDVVIA